MRCRELQWFSQETLGDQFAHFEDVNELRFDAAYHFVSVTLLRNLNEACLLLRFQLCHLCLQLHFSSHFGGVQVDVEPLSFFFLCLAPSAQRR